MVEKKSRSNWTILPDNIRIEIDEFNEYPILGMLEILADMGYIESADGDPKTFEIKDKVKGFSVKYSGPKDGWKTEIKRAWNYPPDWSCKEEPSIYFKTKPGDLPTTKENAVKFCRTHGFSGELVNLYDLWINRDLKFIQEHLEGVSTSRGKNPNSLKNLKNQGDKVSSRKN